jgi:hypothetical protein
LNHDIAATDGDIGRASDFYFDDEKWTIRYLVLDTPNRLSGRSVLISPIAIEKAGWDSKRIYVTLNSEQVLNSPSIESDQPVSRQWETQYYAFYRWPTYWPGPGLWGAWPTPMGAARATYVPPPELGPSEAGPATSSGDSHLRSAQDVLGYEVEARDGSAGSVEDFLLDEWTWEIKHIMVDTTSWWPGGEVLIGPELAQEVDFAGRRILFDLSREDIQSRPEFRPSGPTAH